MNKKMLMVLVAFIMITISVTACAPTQSEVFNSVPEGVDRDELRVTYERENLIQLLQITKEEVNIREAATTKSNVLSKSVGSEYYVLINKGDEWNEIKYNGRTAFVHNDYSAITSVLASKAQAYLDGAVAPVTSPSASPSVAQ